MSDKKPADLDWYPFGRDMDDDTDFSLEVAMSVDRIAPRAVRIMMERVAELSLVLWPTCDYPNSDNDDWTATNPRVEICAFGPDCTVAAHINVDDWIRSSFSTFGHCGDQEEIDALERVKAACEEMIGLRRKRLAGRAVPVDEPEELT
jgi:hypothetical protein